LSFATETIRRLHQGNQLSHSKGTQAGKAEPLTGRMLPTLDQQLPPHSPVQSSQEVELFIELLGSTPHASFAQPLQPGFAMPRRIDLLSATGNTPAAIHRFEPTDHPGRVLGQGAITARQLLQGA